MAAPELQPGHDLGPYRVVRCLGRGGMGAVYEVVHKTLGTHLALKLFTLEGDDADFLRQRFLTEGRILARLRHPRLVRVYDLAVDEGTGSPYFTMDLVLGPNGQPTTLENVRRSGRANETEVARWYADVLEGLRAVHAAGIVHRDVKLENVLLDAEGHVVLSDFGVSRILSKGLGKEIEAVATESIKTPEDAQVLGTKGYLAPEVRKGEKATAAADYYALGFMLFRLLTGVWYEPGTDVFDLLAPFDPRWRDVLGALLEPDPAKRRALPMDVKGMPARRKHRWWIMVVLLALGAAAFVAAVARRPGEANEIATEAALATKLPKGSGDTGRFTASTPISAQGDGTAEKVLASASQDNVLTLKLGANESLEFVSCPAGTFQMGLKGNHAPDSIRREHKVVITRPFWFGKYPMTVAQWEAVTGESVEMTPAMQAIGKAHLPMNATKGRLMACCSNLTERFAGDLPRGYVFRPPTEAEWEYVCRGCGTDPDDVYNRFFRDDDCRWLYAADSSYLPEATNLYIYTDESLAAILRARGVTEIPSFTSWSGTRMFAPIGGHAPNAWGVYDLNVGGTGEISLDSVDPDLRAAADGNPGYGSGQTALVYADVERDPLRCGSTNAEAFVQLVFARGTHKLPMMAGASCRNTLRLVIGPDLLARLNRKREGFRVNAR